MTVTAVAARRSRPGLKKRPSEKTARHENPKTMVLCMSSRFFAVL